MPELSKEQELSKIAIQLNAIKQQKQELWRKAEAHNLNQAFIDDLHQRLFQSLKQLKKTVKYLPEEDQIDCLNCTNQLLQHMLSNNVEDLSKTEAFDQVVKRFEEKSQSLNTTSLIYKCAASLMSIAGEAAAFSLLFKVIVGTSLATIAAPITAISAISLLTLGLGLFLYERFAVQPELGAFRSIKKDMEEIAFVRQSGFFSNHQERTQTHSHYSVHSDGAYNPGNPFN